MPKASPRLKTKVPVSVFQKPLKADMKGLFKSLGKGLGHVATGKWAELSSDAVESLGAIGLVTDPGELASLLIRRSAVRAVFELVADSAAKSLADSTKSSDALAAHLDASLVAHEIHIDRAFLERPERLALVADLQPYLKRWLEGNDVAPVAAESISSRLPTYFVYALNQEWRANAATYQPLLAALDTPFSRAGDREWGWASYAASLEKRIQESVFDEPFSLAQLYVPLNAFYIDDKPIASAAGDSLLRTSHVERRVVVALEDELGRWLNDAQPHEAMRVVSGGPGSGKSSFARIFAARVARVGKIRVLFVPLHLIDPSKALVDELGRFCREEGLLAHNPLDPESPEARLLVILDGLDELASQGKAAAETARAFLREVDRAVEKRNLQGTKLQVLISGRELAIQENESEFRRPRQVLTLLPYFVPRDEHSRELEGVREVEYEDPKALLKKDLRQEWWRKYGTLSGRSYAGLPEELNRPDLAEVTGQPLLNFLVALSLTRGKLDFTRDINLNVIYSDLVGAVYERGYERTRTYGPIRHMSLDQFYRVLEEVGLAAWHGDGRSTTVREIEEHCRLSGVGPLLEAFQDGAKAGVTRLLAAFFFRQQGQRASGDPTFVFTHKSFGEYLTSKRLVRAAERMIRETERRSSSPDEGWDEREALKHWAQLCGASAMTRYLREFLVREIGLREEGQTAIWQERLAHLFTYLLKHGMPMEQLQSGTFRETLFRSRNAEEGLLVILNACALVTRLESPVKHDDPTAFGAWFRRVQGQRTSAEPSLAAECLSFLNLEDVFLDIADLYRARLFGSDLRGVAAHVACLELADLHGADLRGAKLWKANLFGASLQRARLTEADLQDADLRNAAMDGAQVGKLKLRGARLSSIRPDNVREALEAEQQKEEERIRRPRQARHR
jgi:uncharacterized protein YjbI with pentapeptide repeats